MKIIMAQRECFNEITKAKSRCRKAILSDREVLITPDGLKAFVLPYDSLYINIDKISDFKFDTNVLAASKELEMTNDAQISRSLGSKRIVTKLIAKDGEYDEWVDDRFLDYFDGACFFSSGPYAPIVVKERDYRNSKLNTVGIIAPIKMGGLRNA